jgi:hypothetical protein
MWVKLFRPFYVNDDLKPAGVYEFADDYDKKALPKDAQEVDGPEPAVKPAPIKGVLLSSLNEHLEIDPLTGKPKSSAQLAAEKKAAEVKKKADEAAAKQ